MKVCKFGGSSLSCGAQFQKVKKIILSEKGRNVIVVSAPGKQNDADRKITDLLEDFFGGKDVKEQIINRYASIIQDLNLSISLDFYEVFSKPHPHDYIVSRGEYWNAQILASYLSYTFIDAKDVLIFNGKEIDEKKSSKALKKVIKAHPKIVLGGFYGGNDGKVQLFERGGSDISGAICAQLLKADLYENWTDVCGVLTASPRVVSHPYVIPKITYDNLRELCCMGATVLHEDAIYPLKESNIKTQIKNTNEPSAQGTYIVSNEKEPPFAEIIGISGSQNGNICIVGRNVPSFLFRIVSLLPHKIVSMEMPCAKNVLYLKVKSEDVNDAIRCLHDAFFPTPRN